MKRCFLFLLVGLCSIPTFLAAQNAAKVEIKPDLRLYEVYERADLENWTREAPFIIERLNYYLDHSYYIFDEAELAANGKESTESGKTYPIVVISDLANVNILKLERDQKLKTSAVEEVRYRIKGTKKVLVFFSESWFTENLNQHLHRHH
ncbi:MAG: hypothetical protein RL757_1282 [Bacteroidota bacterium]|jgi:hypothetical protein